MPLTLPKLRIFVSSPGDVGAERAVALAVVERLQLEFRDAVELEAYLWERSILRATDTFQAQIIDVREADLALFILWSRIGTPLPVEQFARADGSAYRSGTEYEFERARESYDRDRRPEILCYLKTAEVRLSLKDRAERSRRNAELDGVGEFVDSWFKNPDGTFRSAFYSFEKTAQFEDLIETHLRDWIRGRLRTISGPTEGRQVWTTSPFRGLQTFDFEHAHIYCGRTAMVADALEAMRRRASEGRPFLMVTGMSGVGKSSLVRAGLLPLLTRPGVIEGVIGWRRAVFKPNVSHQTLLQGFAAALVATDAVPSLGEAGTVERLLVDPAGLTAGIARALDLETAKARDAAPDPETDGTVRLVVLVDQFEEIFDETVSGADRSAFVEALRLLVLAGRVWVLTTLRADFFSRTSELPEHFRDLFIERGGLFTVGGPRAAEIAQMIRRPAAMAGLEFERRGDPEEGLDEVLRDAAAGHATVLPLLEFTLDELWRRRSESGVLGFADYEEIGGLQGALRLRADETFAGLSDVVQGSLPQVLAAIVHTDPTDERRILQNRVSTAQFDNHPACRRLIQAFTEAHLLVGDVAPDGTPVVALAHEALLREWPPAVQWISDNRATLRLRAGISAAAALWRNSDQKEGRLLSGELLADSVKLAKENGAILGGDERAFIKQSQRSERAHQLVRLKQGAIAFVLVLLTLLVPIIGVNQLSHAASITWALPRVLTADKVLPVSARTRANLQGSIDRLSAMLWRELELRPESSPWSTAQIRVALHGLPPRGPEPPDFRAYMTETRDARCKCWRETTLKPPNEMATAWVLSAFAILGVRPAPEEIDALLDRQHADGWWPIYLSMPVAQNASTAATALELLSLQRLLDHGLVEPDQRERAANAIERAITWLSNIAPAGSAKWPPYPPPPVGTYEEGEYPAISALVTHVLRTVTGTWRYDSPWLQALPEAVPAPRSNEISKASVLIAESGRRRLAEIDDSRMYRFPWMLLATVEASATGGPVERARALVWVEDALRDPLGEDDFASESWIVGEVLFVLRQIEARLDGRPSPAGRNAATARADGGSRP